MLIQNTNLQAAQQRRVEKLYGIYLDAMKTAFDEGNSYIKHAMTTGTADLNSALKVRSDHISNIAQKYQEFNIDSLARFFNVSALEIRKAANLDRQ